MKAHTKLSLKRWWDLVCYAGAGVLIGLLVFPLWSRLLTSCTAFDADLKWLSQPIKWVLLLLLIYLCWELGRFRLKHVRWLWKYPPTFVAVILGWCFALGIACFCDTVSDPDLLFFADYLTLIKRLELGTAAVIVILIGHWAFLSILDRKKPLNTVSKSEVRQINELVRMPLEMIVDWVRNEAPINSDSEDLWNATIRASRIWESLQTPRPNREGKDLKQSVVIQGPYGSGKTSIVNLLRRRAEAATDCTYVIAHISCWGFSSRGAPQHILEKAISALATHVDCWGLRLLPTNYVEALKATNSWLAALTHLFSLSASPVEQLKRFTPVLQAINAWLVIVLEDADRTGSDFDEKDIEAMLNNFRDVERVSFVFNAGRDSRIEFPRVAERVEFLSDVPQDVVLILLNKVRQHCLTVYNDVDPSLNRPSVLRVDTDDEDTALRAELIGVRVAYWAPAASRLIKTPRQLKAVLGSVMQTWEILHGEVDLDELIMLTILRCAAPGVYSYFGTHYSTLCNLQAKNEQDAGKAVVRNDAENEKLSHLRNRWRDVSEASGQDPEDLTTVLNELLPSTILLTGWRALPQSSRAQSVRSDFGEEYWQRLSSRSLERGIMRDQEVLRILDEAAVGNGTSKLGELIARNVAFAERLRFFEKYYPRLSDAKAQATASTVLRCFSRSPKKSLRQSPSGESFLAWLYLYLKADSSWSAWLKEELGACFPDKLRLATELWFNVVRGRYELQLEFQLPLRVSLVDNAREHFERISPQQFAKCFDQEHPYILRNILWIERGTYPEQFLIKPEQWTWIAPSLIQGLEKQPDVFIPQVLLAFGEVGPSGGAVTWFKFDENAMAGVFTDQTTCVYELLSRQCDMTSQTAYIRSAIPLAQKEAQRLCAVMTVLPSSASA